MRNWMTLSLILLFFIPSLLQGQTEFQKIYSYREVTENSTNHDSVKRLSLSQWILNNKELPEDLATFSQVQYLSICPPVFRRDRTELLGTLYTYRDSKLKKLSGLSALPQLSTLRVTLNRRISQRKLLNEIRELTQLTSLTIELKRLNSHSLKTLAHLKNLRKLQINLYIERPDRNPQEELLVQSLQDCKVDFFYSGRPFITVENDYRGPLWGFIVGLGQRIWMFMRLRWI